MTLIEPVLQDLVGLELNGVGLMDLPPEELGTLDSGNEAGFREARERPPFFELPNMEIHTLRGVDIYYRGVLAGAG